VVTFLAKAGENASVIGRSVYHVEVIRFPGLLAKSVSNEILKLELPRQIFVTLEGEAKEVALAEGHSSGRL
jgi:hypothetical protein